MAMISTSPSLSSCRSLRQSWRSPSVGSMEQTSSSRALISTNLVNMPWNWGRRMASYMWMGKKDAHFRVKLHLLQIRLLWGHTGKVKRENVYHQYYWVFVGCAWNYWFSSFLGNPEIIMEIQTFRQANFWVLFMKERSNIWNFVPWLLVTKTSSLP